MWLCYGEKVFPSYGDIYLAEWEQTLIKCTNFVYVIFSFVINIFILLLGQDTTEIKKKKINYNNNNNNSAAQIVVNSKNNE